MIGDKRANMWSERYFLLVSVIFSILLTAIFYRRFEIGIHQMGRAALLQNGLFVVYGWFRHQRHKGRKIIVLCMVIGLAFFLWDRGRSETFFQLNTFEKIQHKAVEIGGYLSGRSPAQVPPEGLWVIFALVSVCLTGVVIDWRKSLLLGLILPVLPFFVGSTTSFNVVDMAHLGAGWTIVLWAQFERLDGDLIRIGACMLIVSIVFLGAQLLPDDLFFNRDIYDWAHSFSIREVLDSSRRFSLERYGFYPSSQAIGGKIDPKKHPILEVEGPPEAFYLRSDIYEDFVDGRWIRSNPNPRYAFVDLTEDTSDYLEQNLAFAYKEPGHRLVEDSQPEDVRILNSRLGRREIRYRSFDPNLKTLFIPNVPYRIYWSDQDETSEDFHYNAVGQMTFKDRIGDREVRIEGHVYFSEPMDQNDFTGPVEEREAVGKYRNLVAALDGELANELYRSKEEIQTDYERLPLGIDFEAYYQYRLGEKMRRLTETFQRDFEYVLETPVFKEDMEFLEWFLTEKEGYCVHFATATALLLRDIGIEARYVEGLLVPQAPNAETARSKRVVTSERAHAWNEVLVPGFGWVPLDTTPISYQTSLANAQTVNTAPDNDEEFMEPILSVEPPVQENIESPIQIETNENEKRTFPYWLLIMPALIAFVWERRQRLKNRHSLGKLQRKTRNDHRLMVSMIWADIQRIAQISGRPILPSVAVREALDGTFRDFRYREIDKIEQVIQLVEKVVYSDYVPKKEELKVLMRVYGYLEGKLKRRMPRMQWIIYRFFGF